ncbi:hypothetical protein KVR01_009545 [Diaporthe batatas]|uniref:uncharacterized protein n=1 Tax=Diaporthe batatas TaxID=748121 RepID=UPI001D052BC0|nr:uncharacterized protein KVR01_009545 [Diaporthe batatas]KAG8161281.1 hypothetical protein KVR01_009545 [Diaporthe batatas]
MRFLITLLNLVVLTLVLEFCAAAPLTSPDQDVSIVAGDRTPLNITGIPGNTSTHGLDPAKTSNRCYDWDTSEKWKDVGGQHSEFVNQSVYDLCQQIAVEAYKGFPAGNTVSHCKEVRKGTQGKNYDRSIGIALRYGGPQLKYDEITAGYCNERMEKPLDCGAGGEFDLQVDNPSLPFPWVSDRWEALADPNRGKCRANGYSSDFK